MAPTDRFFRDLSYCPDAVTTSYDGDVKEDAGFSVSCIGGSDLKLQDPGIPAAPLEVLKAEKAISASARQTLTSSACFRLMSIAYFLILKLAEDVK